MYLIFGCFVAGCAPKPDHVATIETPTKGFFYTVETFLANGGPPVPEETSVYANLTRDGQTVKKLVLKGEELTVERITLDGPYEATICFDGYTDTFHNSVNLSLSREVSENVVTHLEENCKRRRDPHARTNF
jgi:hypothetical protein